MKIFIGSSAEVSGTLLLQIAAIVEGCGITPIRWNSRGVFIAGNYTLETLEDWATKVDAAIFICSADDRTWYRGKELGTPRDNVVFEHGLFLGKLGRGKSIIVKSGNVELPSDLNGVTYIDFTERRLNEGESCLREKLEKLKEEHKQCRLDYFLSINEDVYINEKYKVEYEDLFTDDELHRINDPRKTPQKQFRTIDEIWTAQVKLLEKDCQRLMFIYEKLVFLSYFPYRSGKCTDWLQTAISNIQNKELLEYKIILPIKKYIEEKQRENNNQEAGQLENNNQKAGQLENNNLDFYKDIATQLYDIKGGLTGKKINPLIEMYLNDYIGLAYRHAAMKKGCTRETKEEYLERSIEALKRCEDIKGTFACGACVIWGGYGSYNMGRTYEMQGNVSEFGRYMRNACITRENWLTMDLINHRMPRVFEHSFKAEFLVSLSACLDNNLFDGEEKEEIESIGKEIYNSLISPKIPHISIVKHVIKKFKGRKWD